MIIDKGFYRRLKFYIFGFLIGALIVNILFKGRACRMPGTIKLEELREQTLEYNPKSECTMICKGIDSVELKEVLTQGKINYGKSDVHKSPCPTYAVEGTTQSNKKLQIVIGDCDTISRILTIIDLNSETDTCKCD